jgi:hypothetical protein
MSQLDQTHRAQPRVLESREISHSRGPKESKLPKKDDNVRRATERKGNIDLDTQQSDPQLNLQPQIHIFL